MPELPEVENVKLSLVSLGSVGQKFVKVELLRKGLRVPFPKGISQLLSGQSLLSVHRRAKYLLFETETHYLLNHLGMTGSWRVFAPPELIKHDHVILHFASGLKLVFNDPRRFGVLDLFPKAKLEKNRWLKHLGVEPLTEDFNADYLLNKTRKLSGPIKGFLMDQKRVVGVGNIYASEALFAAKVKPTRAAGKITRTEAEALVENIKRILKNAIQAGGSTIRDYRNSNGEDGSYQAQFLVYGRNKKPCLVCAKPIRSKVIAGRNTFWCAQCQR